MALQSMIVFVVLAVMVCSTYASQYHMVPTGVEDPRFRYRHPPYMGEKPQPSPGIQANMTFVPDDGRDSYQANNRLKGKVAIITGGDSGIGRATAVAFAKEGARGLVIGYLPVEQVDADETKRVVERFGCKCELVAGDLAFERTAQQLIDRAVNVFGGIDVLVNNAAFQGGGIMRVEDIDRERAKHTFLINVVAMIDMVRLAVPHMKAGASIINVASIQAYKPSFVILDYASSKGAVVTLSKALASDLIKRGIRVNVVAPGPVWTPLIIQSGTAESLPYFGSYHPYGRPAQPAELAPAFVYLASDAAQYTNGEILGVTGTPELP